MLVAHKALLAGLPGEGGMRAGRGGGGGGEVREEALNQRSQ